MEIVDTTQINSFVSRATPDLGNSDLTRSERTVSPANNTIFVLTSDQLRSIVTGAIKEATGAIRQELDLLQRERANDQREIAALRAQVRSLESTEEQDITRVCLDIAQDRQRISRLERVEPQPMQKDRGEILRALLVANGGKMLLKDARQRMHLSRSTFSQLIATIKDDVELKQFHLRKNQKVIILRSCLTKQ